MIFKELQLEISTQLHPLPIARMFTVLHILPTYLNILVLIYKENSNFMKFNINNGMAQLVHDMTTGSTGHRSSKRCFFSRAATMALGPTQPTG
jgi:hypothetical protein